MIAKDRGRKRLGYVLGFAVAGLAAGGTESMAQSQPRRPLLGSKPAASAPKADEKAQAPEAPVDPNNKLTLTAIPVNPTDPIAIVNDQVISRQQLADECVAREGKKVLETLINRAIVDQALKGQKKEVTAAEIDAEISNVAHRFGISREAWLRTLDKERNISPAQYARDLIYPTLALRKLSEAKVQVTDKDLRDAFESQYGDKLRCRMIMVDKLGKAQAIWEELRKNPAGFEKIAQEQSMDSGSRSLGGLLAQPITRHAYPQTLSDAAFQQLVDGDPADRDPNHKPKDGDFTGPIQMAESTWVIFRREGVIPAVEGVSLKDERIRKNTYDMIYEVKLKETMGLVFQALIKAAAIDNKLIGSIKLANEEQDPDFNTADRSTATVRPNAAGTADDKAVRTSGGDDAVPGGLRLPAPAAASKETVQQMERIQKTPLHTSNGKVVAPQPATGAGTGSN
ncbi:Foldase protein PrsA precursor [Aquisphaera giovannonii]|uniref:peptidylprolyl isomerase n=1 Tax=Aquisphaera giovannonii TaxID=406548 RepID=A0A5B9WBK8_9BACT|nr:peptidylprolyl isomerase [Aquisphaera giovannonii]QEH37589.1 Foldase protein PrsA precursor [Aquisphaera giovannonii]